MPRAVDIERPLGFLEWAFWLIEQIGRVNFVVAAEISGPLTPDVLRKALNIVQAHQPLLRVRVAPGPRNRLWFRSDNVSSIPLRVIDLPRENWVEEAEREREEPFPSDAGPLCRCVLLRHSEDQATLLTTINHIIGDGISGTFLVRSILRVAGALCEGHQPDLGSQPLGLSQDDRLPRWTNGTAGIATALRNRIHETFRRWKLGKAESTPTDAVAPLHQRRCRLVPLELDTDQTSRLLSRIRPARASLHGVLAAAQLRAIAHEFADRDPITLSLVTGTNLRSRLEPPVANDELGLFASMVESRHRVQRDESLWTLAAEVSQTVRNKIEGGMDLMSVAKGPATLAALRWWLPPTEQGQVRFARMLARRPPPTSMISVIPRGEQIVRASDYGPLAIESLHGFGAGPRTPLFSMSSVSHGRLHWNFVYLEPILGRDRAHRIAHRAVDEICQSIGQRNPACAPVLS
jgi:hypothetical protein